MAAMAEADKDELLKAARRVLRRDRVAATTLEAVANEAGVNAKDVERCFGDRGLMLHELSVAIMTEYTETLAVATAHTESGEEALDVLVRTLASLATTDMEGFRLNAHAAQVLPEMMRSLPRELAERYTMIGRRVSDRAEAQLIADWGDQALPYGVHPRRLAFVATLLSQGFVTMKGMMAATGGNLTHSDDDLIDAMCQVISSPPRMIRQLTALNAVSRELASMRSEKELLQRVPHMLTSALDFDRASLMMDNIDEGLMPVAHSWPNKEEAQLVAQLMADHRLEPAPHFRRAIAQDATIHLQIPAEDPDWPRLSGPDADELMDKLGLMTPMVITPIRYQGKPVGVIVGHTHLRWRPMDGQDISRVEAFAAMVGIALENVRMYENLNAMVDERTRELREAQVALVQSEKMASMGQLVAGVAHELNTPVGAIGSAQDSLRKAADKLRKLLGDEREARVDATLNALTASAAVVETGSERIDAIVKRLRSFARLDEASLQQTDVHACIDAAIAMLEHQLPQAVKLERQFAELPTMRCDPRKLNQLFANLLVNAIDAVGDTGHVGVTTSVDDSALEIEIADSGAGIAPRDLEKIFDPGFTTKGVGVGAGLGLSIAFRIVEDHGGSIRADSVVGEGTRVTVRLPRG
jgi:signal transduction histidine kinase/AcrR family transcriptional regulator